MMKSDSPLLHLQGPHREVTAIHKVCRVVLGQEGHR